MPVASLQKVTKYFGSTLVINDLSLSFNEGQLTCLLGSSGSGKTTILRLLAGLESADSGKIHINGKLASEDNKILLPPAKRGIGFIFQDLALWPHMTVYENIAFGLKVNKVAKAEEKIANILDFLGIQGHQNKYPSQLSGGQQQLVAIARSLVLNPKLLLMDEPLANLDVKLKSKIRAQIKEVIKNFSVTIVYVTHDHHEAFGLADEIVVIDNGKIMESGTPQDIRRSDNPFVKEFIEF